MPLMMTCDEMRAGMQLAEPLRQRGRAVVAAGKALSEGDVAEMRRQYPGATFRTADAVLDELTAFEPDAGQREVADRAIETIATYMAEVQRRFTAERSLRSLTFDAAKAAGGVLQYVRAHPVAAAAIFDRDHAPAAPLAEHAGRVFFLSSLMGMAAREYIVQERQRQTAVGGRLSPGVALDLLPLGLAAMLMDVGMFELTHLLAEGHRLTDADRAALRAHPDRGAELLPRSLPAVVRTIVRSHHENADGTGYPKAQGQETLHVFARIVRICDAFVAATSRRVYREAKSPVRALWEMRFGPWRHCYDRRLMDTFAGLIRPFPVGSRIELEDGRGAVVVRQHAADPFWPTVMVAYDTKGERLPLVQIGAPVQLGHTRGLRARRFAGEDVSYIYADCNAREPARARPPERFGCLMDAAYP